MNNIEGHLNLPSDALECIVACRPRSPRQDIVLTKTERLSELVTPFILCRGNKTLYWSNVEIRSYFIMLYYLLFKENIFSLMSQKRQAPTAVGH